MHFKLRRHQGSGGLVAVQWTHLLLMLYWAGSAACVALKGASFAEQLQAWGDDIDANSLPMLLLPWPLAFLVSKRKWSRLLLLARWHRSFRLHRQRVRYGPLAAWPPAEASVWNQLGQDEGRADMEDVPPLTADALADLGQSVRQWAPIILEGAAPPDNARQTLEAAAAQLDGWRFTWQQAMGMLAMRGGGGRYRHDARKLLSAIQLCSRAKAGPSGLADIVAKSLALALPEFLRAPLVDSVGKPSPELASRLPSASLVSSMNPRLT